MTTNVIRFWLVMPFCDRHLLLYNFTLTKRTQKDMLLCQPQRWTHAQLISDMVQ